MTDRTGLSLQVAEQAIGQIHRYGVTTDMHAAWRNGGLLSMTMSRSLDGTANGDVKQNRAHAASLHGMTLA